MTDLAAVLARWRDPEVRCADLCGAGLEIDSARATWFRAEASLRATIGVELGFRTAAGEAAVLPGYLKLYADDGRRREIVDKWRTLRVHDTVLGAGFRELPDAGAVLFLFPNDGGMRRLPALADLEKAKRLLGESGIFGEGNWRVRGSRSQLRVVRWKPEHRLVARLDLALKDDAAGAKRDVAAFLRCFPDDRGARQQALAQAIGAGGGAGLIPRPLGALLDGTVFVEEALDGEQLLQGGYRDPGCAQELASMLERMSALRPDGIGRFATADLLAVRRQELATLGEYAGAAPLAELDRALCAALPPEPGARAGLVHGDLHLRQFLACSQGLRLVDFERAAIGDPGLDAGHFVAEFRFAALERPQEAADLFALRDRLLELWRARASEDERRALPFFIAAGLVAGAARIARRVFLGADPAIVPALLDEARHQLAHPRQA